MVKLILPILLFGGVGGLTNIGELGADDCFCGSGFRGALESPRPRLYAAEVLTARFFRFFRFLPRLPGGLAFLGMANMESGDVVSSGVNLEASIAKFIEDGDCGDGAGDGSVMEHESKDTVVVGEDSVDSEAEVEVLFRG